MKKKIWDLYAPIYEKAMRADYKYYKFMYDRIPTKIQNKEVLELATGPGLLAKHVAYAAKRMVATDYSEGMIREAQKGKCVDNLIFEVADATDLPYENHSFDVVLIANALHIMPEPEKALKEIERVLKEDGRANCSLTKHSRDGNKLAEQGNEILEYSWYKSGQNPPAGKDRVMNLFNY